MKRVPVNSTNILSVGYDENSQMLEVEFNTKRIYRFSNVPAHVYSGLMRSKSHGKYFLTHITNNYSQSELKK